MLLAPPKNFHFDEETHTYTLDGKLLPSITQILDELGYIDKDYFTDEHRHRGTYVHWCARLLNEGQLDMDDVDPQYRGFVDSYTNAVATLKIVPVYFEQPRYHPQLLFAGTPDIITATAIYELKTGEIRPWVALQTAGHDLLERAFDPSAKRRRRFGLRLRNDGTFDRPVEFKNWIQDESVFKNNVAAVRNKALYGAPILRGLTKWK